MRLSAGLVLLGGILLGLQVAFSDGAAPVIVSLPIGVWPLAGGIVAVAIGLGLGLIVGTFRYRIAAGMGLIATGLAGFGLLFIHSMVPGTTPPAFSVNGVALLLAAVVWAIAIAIGIDELRRASRRAATRGM